MKTLLLDTAHRAASFRSLLSERPVMPSPEALARLKRFDEPFPQRGTSPEVVIQQLDENGSPAAVASAGGRFFGFVVGSSLPAALAANWLVTAWDQEGGQSLTAPLGAFLEEICIQWLIGLFGLPPGTGAGFVTGATMANFCGLAAARHALLECQGWDVEAQGLFGAPPLSVIAGEEVHASVLKALGMLGLGRERLIRVTSDRQGRMQPDSLTDVLRFAGAPAIVCAQAGHVATGAVDPLPEICRLAHAAGAWVHIDGAFGMWAAAAPARAPLVVGIGEADSWALDAHKWLNVPYDSGLIFVRQPQHLCAAMAVSADYLPTSGQRQPDAYVPEMSRRARGVEVWAALKSLGKEGLADLVERCCRYADYFAKGLQAAGYEILNDVTLNQVLVSFGNDDLTRKVIAAIQAGGICWCGGTIFKGRAAMRISVSSWATTQADCEQSLAAILLAAENLC
jgi:glutamate/tyrosine decarboxylase-like PLP-dependent enzyme